MCRCELRVVTFPVKCEMECIHCMFVPLFMVANLIALLIQHFTATLLSFPFPASSERSKDDYVTQQAKLPRPIKLSAGGNQQEKKTLCRSGSASH